jgi:hypothetical protein
MTLLFLLHIQNLREKSLKESMENNIPNPNNPEYLLNHFSMFTLDIPGANKIMRATLKMAVQKYHIYQAKVLANKSIGELL